MPGSAKGGRYHHGDLRAALIDTAIGLIGERGVRNFSLAEASRRLGVAVSAPYSHFADRDELLAAVAVVAFRHFYAALVPPTSHLTDPADRLAAMAAAYVRSAAASRPLFDVLYETSLDKARHPEIEAAERPLTEAFLASVADLPSGPGDASPGQDRPAAGPDQAGELAEAIEATAYGHVMLLPRGHPDSDDAAVERTAWRAAQAVRALVESRHLLARPGPVSGPGS